MTRMQTRGFLAAGLVIVGAGAIPGVCRAEAYGPPDPQLMLIVGAVFGLPSALLCLLSEAVLPRRLVPRRVAIGAACGFVIAAALALRATRIDMPGTPTLFFLWSLVPAFATLALRAFVPPASVRLALGWLLATAVLGLVQWRLAGEPNRAFLLGGAASCALIWSLTLLAVRLSGAVPAPDARAQADFSAHLGPLRAALARSTAAAFAELKAAYAGLTPARSGLLWWLGSAALVYFAIGGLMTAGMLDELWFDAGLSSWVEYTAWRLPHVTKPVYLWWLYGVPWSLLVGGAVWGLAATFGGFDAGRAKPARLAAIALGVALAGWSIHIALEIAAVDAAERKVDGRSR